MFTDIRHWAKALLDWAEERGLDVNPFTDTHYELSKSTAAVYVNADEPFHRKVIAIRKDAMTGCHVVVDEGADLRVRVRHGYVGALKVVRFPQGTENSVKPVVATMGVATLMDEPLRSDLPASLSGVGAL